MATKKKSKITEFNKLVRSNIPEIIEANGEKPDWVKLDPNEWTEKLKEKLFEEAEELCDADSLINIAFEIADVLEVLETIAYRYDIEWDTILKLQKLKLEDLGGFYDKIFLKSVESDDS
jgi:predicted house-cleaning noncanonical NTP pyrophosphatase (MazG superfamily)